ncbi:MAG: ABC transporter permease [Alphaproteobacteria bacterium]
MALTFDKSKKVSETLEKTQGRSLTQDAMRRFKRNKLAMVSVYIFIFLLLVAIIGPFVWPHPFDEVFWDSIGAGPKAESMHYFGFDVNGRDMVARIISGLGTSLIVAGIATSVSIVVGVSYGAISGYLGGRVDEIMMRFVDVMYALPYILFIILLQVIFGRHLVLLFVGIGLLEWITMARIVRGQTLSLKEKEFVEAAKAAGRSPLQIIFQHIIPNLIGPVVIYATLTVPEIILTESFLSFIGFGVQESDGASLGTLINQGAERIGVYWWMFVFPAIILITLLFSLIFIGEGLRDAFDPKDR